MDKIEFSTFPKNRTDALTMLYLQQQDLRDLSPTEIADKYLQVHKELATYLLTHH